MLNKELESSLNGAFARARDKRHEFMTVEHLLLALLENDAAREALLACQADIDVFTTDVEFPTRTATRGVPRAIFRSKRSDGSQRAGGDFQ